MKDSAAFASFAADLNLWIEEVGRGHATHEDRFPSLAQRLFDLQRQCVPLLAELCDARGLPRGELPDWREIPAVPTQAFKEFVVTSVPADQRVATFHSSQTTGRDFSRCFHDRASLALYEWSALTWFQIANGLRPGVRRRVLALTPDPAGAPHSSLVRMFEFIRREHGDARSAFLGRTDAAGGWQVAAPDAWAALRAAADDHAPVVLLGAAFSFVHLLEGREPGARALRLPAGSFALETGGYKGRSRALPRAELHAALAEALGLPAGAIRTEYGMCELSSQAYDWFAAEPPAAPRVFRFPPWARAVVVSPETGREVGEGESGLLRVYDLANVRSVLAIQTEDLARRRGGGFEWLGRAAEARGCSLLPAAP